MELGRLVSAVYHASDAIQVKTALCELAVSLGLAGEAKTSDEKIQDHLSMFLKHYFEGFAGRLFEEICPKWFPCLTQEEKLSYIDPFFGPSFPADSVLVSKQLVSYFCKCPNAGRFDECLDG